MALLTDSCAAYKVRHCPDFLQALSEGGAGRCCWLHALVAMQCVVLSIFVSSKGLQVVGQGSTSALGIWIACVKGWYGQQWTEHIEMLHFRYSISTLRG